MSKMVIHDFIYGTQYYRAPTPLPGEWEGDLKNMGEIGLDTIQLRIQWRWNEPREGQYEFDDIDRLFDLSVHYHKKVILKFVMDAAPDYIFHKYNGYRKDMQGLPLNPGAHGAYYIGGWWPCFDNPDVIRKAVDFVRVFVERYKNKQNLILWNIWNEPRSYPIGDCGCPHSIDVYRKWLKQKYESINNLNGQFGKKWEDFSTIMPPAMPHDYVELFLWRQWALHAIKQRLVFMYKAVTELDSARPVISHSCHCNILQDVANDAADDLENSRVVDFYGTSLITAPVFKNILDEARPFIICDWLRSVSRYYWVYELYPDWGNWNRTVSAGDFKFKVWSTIACGAKGLMYWQYRAERLGNENNLSGLVHMDGRFKGVTHEAAKIGSFIREHHDFLVKAKVKDDGIGILYSLESDLINRIENTGGKTRWDFDLLHGAPYLYKKALWGTYALFRELGYTTTWIDIRALKEKLPGLKALFIPECFIIPDEALDLLNEFVAAGGYVIAEEGIGLRKENTWLNFSWPAVKAAELFGVTISERIFEVIEKDSITIFGHTIPAAGYISYLVPNKPVETIGCWSDGRIGATRNGNAFFLGTSLGASFYNNYNSSYHAVVDVLAQILALCKLETRTAYAKRNLYIRELVHNDSRMVFIFNRSGQSQRIAVKGDAKKIKKLSDSIEITPTADGMNVTVLPGEVGIYITIA